MHASAQSLAALLGLSVLAVTGLTAPATAAPTSEPKPDRYIVRTDSAAATSGVAADLRRSGGTVDNVYTRVFPGLSATLTADQVSRLRADEDVDAVVRDEVFRSTAVQKKPTWGLDRIDQRSAKRNQSYRYRTTGKGVTAFVLDTGLLTSHRQFGDRAYSGLDFVDYDDDAEDCHGHGTHVAGTVAGRTYGVAKGVTVVGVRVLDCEGAGYASDIIDALDYVVAVRPEGPAVVNLSLGGPTLTLLDDAVTRTVRAGIPVVVSAGNEGASACSSSPARAKLAITVAATDKRDSRPGWSNYGRCVDIFAPGVDVRSAVSWSDTATAVASGTSMAAPHVTGAVARYLQTHPKASSAKATSAVVRAATAGKVRNRSGAPNRLLYTPRG